MSSVEQRREARKRRILMNPEDRMKKIMGVPNEMANQDRIVADGIETCNQVTHPDVLKAESLQTDDSPSLQTLESESFDEGWILGQTKHTEIKKRNNRENSTHSVNHSNHISSQTKEQSIDVKQVEKERDTESVGCTFQSCFTKIRFLLCLLAGALVRVSLTHSFGQNYVQTSVYPFVALEIAFAGYQRATNMLIGDTKNTSGGLYVAALQLAGVNAKVIYTYRLLIGFIMSMAEDFAAFAFMFIITHVLVT